jgi:hypothetical protein
MRNFVKPALSTCGFQDCFDGLHHDQKIQPGARIAQVKIGTTEKGRPTAAQLVSAIEIR